MEFDLTGKLLKSSTNKLFMSRTSDWEYFGPSTYTLSWKEGASIAIIAAAIAGKVGGYVGSFMGAASALFGSSIGCRIEYWGRYKFEGSHIRGEYTVKYTVKMNIFIPLNGVLTDKIIVRKYYMLTDKYTLLYFFQFMLFFNIIKNCINNRIKFVVVTIAILITFNYVYLSLNYVSKI